MEALEEGDAALSRMPTAARYNGNIFLNTLVPRIDPTETSTLTRELLHIVYRRIPRPRGKDFKASKKSLDNYFKQIKMDLLKGSKVPHSRVTPCFSQLLLGRMEPY